jgi:hypothetical protein
MLQRFANHALRRVRRCMTHVRALPSPLKKEILPQPHSQPLLPALIWEMTAVVVHASVQRVQLEDILGILPSSSGANHAWWSRDKNRKCDALTPACTTTRSLYYARRIDMHGGWQGLACLTWVCVHVTALEISGQYMLLYPSMSCRLVLFVCSPEDCVSRVMAMLLWRCPGSAE